MWLRHNHTATFKKIFIILIGPCRNELAEI